MTGPAGDTPRRKRRRSTRARKPATTAPPAETTTPEPTAAARSELPPIDLPPILPPIELPPIEAAIEDANDEPKPPEDDPWAAILGPVSTPDDVPAPEPAEAPRDEPATQPPETSSRADQGSIRAWLAAPSDLADWDAHTVASPNGNVYQSLAWGEYRAAHGRPVWHVVFDDGFRMLVVGRDRPVVGGGWAYATRGPIPEDDAALTAARVAKAAELLADEGLDSFTVDGETPADSGLGSLLRARGFRAVEEVQTSRHRMDVNLGPQDAHNSDEKTIFGSFGATTRNNIRQAERHGLRVKRLDAGGGRAEHDEPVTGTLEGTELLSLDDPARTEQMLRMFYVMLDATAERRGFALASEDAFLDWSQRALAAGHMFYLQAEHDVDGPVAGAIFYRHGHRLTYSLAGDRAELRKGHPGAVRLLVWRGIQVALDERRLTVDLGGVDTEGSRGRPNKGDPTYGMYAFKESFGARWVDLTGAHQRTMRPMRNLAGKLLGRLGSLRR